MKIFAFSRKGFLYIDNGVNLISQQTTSDESNMMNKYCSLIEYKNFDEANDAYKLEKLQYQGRMQRENNSDHLVPW
tara:strand:- start:519 stop:746 length:228 start_codon:yes stop_codon:yes gene_type:complete